MKKLINYFSPHSLTSDISLYGYSFSLKTYIISIIAVISCITMISLIFQLQPVYILAIVLCGVIMLPWLIRKKYMNNHRLKEFSDVDIYLHQMVYSFIRNPKIHTALSDTYAVADGRLKKLIQEALDELEYSMSEYVYEEALGIIENNYQCSRIRTLHRFLISVETKGGRYKNALQVLLKDFDRWVKNIYEYEYELKLIKRDTTIGIFISIALSAITMFMCLVLNRYSTASSDITSDYIFQISTAIFLILCILFYAYTQTHYGKDILNQTKKDTQCIKDYKNAYESHISSLIIKILPFIAIASALLVYTIIAKHYCGAWVMNLSAFLFANRFAISLFNLSPEAQTMALQVMVWFNFVSLFFWPSSFTLPNILRAAGDARFTMAVSILSMWVFRVGFCYVMVLGFHGRLLSIWMGMFLDWVFRSLCFFVRFARGRWMEQSVI